MRLLKSIIGRAIALASRLHAPRIQELQRSMNDRGCTTTLSRGQERREDATGLGHEVL